MSEKKRDEKQDGEGESETTSGTDGGFDMGSKFSAIAETACPTKPGVLWEDCTGGGDVNEKDEMGDGTR